MSFDIDDYVAHQFERELRDDLRFEMGLALRCGVSVLLVVALIVVRQLYLV